MKRTRAYAPDCGLGVGQAGVIDLFLFLFELEHAIEIFPDLFVYLLLPTFVVGVGMNHNGPVSPFVERDRGLKGLVRSGFSVPGRRRLGYGPYLLPVIGPDRQGNSAFAFVVDLGEEADEE